MIVALPTFPDDAGKSPDAGVTHLCADAGVPNFPLQQGQSIVREFRSATQTLEDFAESLGNRLEVLPTHRASDAILRDFATRLCQRKLFKTYELYAEQAEPNARLEAYEIAKDVARQAGYDPSIYVGLDVSSDVPFDDTYEPLTVVFPDNTQRRPADVSFLLGRLRGQKLMRVRLIFVPELRERIATALMR